MQVGPRLYVTVRGGVLRLERRGERPAPLAPRQLEKARLCLLYTSIAEAPSPVKRQVVDCNRRVDVV